MNVKKAIEKRRAYRSLKPIKIDGKLINDLAHVAQISPSCSNNQPWRFIFIHDKGQLQKLFTTLTPHNNWIEKASMMIAVFSSPKFDWRS